MTTYRRARLSQRAINSLEPEQWLSENLGYGKGSLQVRAAANEALFYYRGGGERTRTSLGHGSGPEAISLDLARDRAWRLATADRMARAGDKSLGALLVGYAERLESRGSATAASVLAMLRRHVQLPHPELWLRSAGKIGPENLLTMLEPLVDEGELPTVLNDNYFGRPDKVVDVEHHRAQAARRAPCGIPAGTSGTVLHGRPNFSALAWQKTP